MERYLCLKVYVDSSEQSEALLAILSEEGFDGFEELPDQLLAYRLMDEWDRVSVIAYLESNKLRYTFSEMEKTNWNQVWESNFAPVRVSDQVGIRADFHEPIPGVRHELIITPKMSFGTGHHSTTRLMVQMMCDLILPEDRVLDFGTGTGVLAILAKKMGAGHVVGIDVEDWSIENAIDNAKVNGVSDIEFHCADRILVTGPFEKILANINRNILLEHLTQLKQALTASGVLLMSGILEEDLEIMDQAMHEVGLRRTAILAENGWICVQVSQIQ